MVDLVTGVALLLLLVAVAGSLLPLVPSGLTALAGVYGYYFFAPGAGEDMGLWLLAGFTVVGLVTALVEHFGGALASKAGGAETETMILAGLSSVLLLFVLGPLGVVVGVVAVVVLAELRAGKEPREAVVASVWTVAGLLGSTVAQFLLTLSMLVGFVTFVLLLS
ncbi:DUF456 domain-containing protein [Halorarum halophilum]|uniref:DUF456 domain-containing protein n=1 Tax=Halorarum halophilum TaxID=2743090 RepID=A0A7D5GJG0_9EURY|nr:DUF456 domain-containing protein [Halobaculum halophilum]QLG26607.1 DUF456 domain-containing protein [Halobaculum halophilum]